MGVFEVYRAPTLRFRVLHVTEGRVRIHYIPPRLHIECWDDALAVRGLLQEFDRLIQALRRCECWVVCMRSTSRLVERYFGPSHYDPLELPIRCSVLIVLLLCEP